MSTNPFGVGSLLNFIGPDKRRPKSRQQSSRLRRGRRRRLGPLGSAEHGRRVGCHDADPACRAPGLFPESINDLTWKLTFGTRSPLRGQLSSRTPQTSGSMFKMVRPELDGRMCLRAPDISDFPYITPPGDSKEHGPKAKSWRLKSLPHRLQFDRLRAFKPGLETPNLRVVEWARVFH